MSFTVFRHTSFAIGITAAIFAVYSVALVPILEPAIAARDSQTLTGTREAKASDRYLTEVESLLEPNSWETATPKVLRYRNTLLLFDDYQPRDNGTISVRPCTVIMRQSTDGGPDAIDSCLVMRAPEGATLQMSKPIGFGTAQLGQPLAGRLKGPIRITSQGRADGSGRLDLATSDVYIDRKLLQTTSEVDFQFEGSRAVGQQLIIHLLPSGANAVTDTSIGWAGIRSIELVKLRQLRLNVTDEGDEPAPVDVACRGPLRVDFMDNTMTLEEDVKLRRHDPSGKIDTLDCDRLEFTFEKQLAKARRRPPKQDKTTPKQFSNTPKLEVTNVIAEGNPVVLRAASHDAQIRSRRLAYDLKRGRFQLWSRTNDPDDHVGVRIEKNDFFAKQLDCQLDAEGELLRVTAQGPGEFSSAMMSDATEDPVRAYWRDQLVFQREQNLRHLTLTGKTWVAMNRDSGIEAEVLHLWLEPHEKQRTSHPDLLALPQPRGTANDKPRRHKRAKKSPMDGSSLRPIELVALSATPDRANAISPVVLTTQGVVGKTDRLEAKFVHLPPEPPPEQQTRPSTTLVTSNNGNRRLANQDQNKPNRQETDPDSATHIEGRNLAVTLEIRGKEVTVGDLKLDDQIQVRHFDLNKGDAPTFELSAKELQVQQLDGRQILTARGRPVQISSDELKFVTAQLHVDQDNSLVWTKQPGRMTVAIDRDANGRRLARPASMTIDWEDGMSFDGRLAKFHGQVEVVGPEQRLRASHVEVLLNKKVSTGQVSVRQAGNLDIKRVAANGSVTLETREYDPASGDLQGILLMRVPSVQLDRETGDLRASGPGTLTTIRDGFQNAGFDQLANPQGQRQKPRRQRQVRAAGANRTFLRVDYQREVSGNLYRRLVEFQNRVQVVYGPVGSFNETLKPNGVLREDDLFMTCDKLTVVQSNLGSTRKRAIDLIAKGNTVVEGQTFTAQGDQISYEQGKGQLILQGTGSTDATLSHQARVGAPSSKTVARKILFWPATRRVEVDDARYLDLSNLGL